QDEDFGSAEQPRFPYIPIGLYLGAVAMAKRRGIETLFVLTEPRLQSHFAKLGVKIQQIGGPVEHRGIRVPSMMDVNGIIKGLRFLVKPVWNVVQDEISASDNEVS
ncbi:MAG: PEP-CTERM/exosortase system-associated acyltransferase, partial [Rhodocyclaceae bacterium]|nr:PEP-CTERM/exosortase system-associated acyltransferase [Rhodocyclaceae bacterium]